MNYDFSCAGKAVDDRINRGVLPGANLCVDIGGERVYEHTVGYSDISLKTPLRRDDIFRLASMTKPVTAVAALIQQDRGKLDVHDEICKYIPELKGGRVGRLSESGEIIACEKISREPTIEDVLTHGSGFLSGEVGDRQFEKCGRMTKERPKDAVKCYEGLYYDFSPGTSQFYSGLAALDLVVRIVEKTSGQDYETFLKENIFEPLGMRDTGYRLDSSRQKRLVKMTRLSDDATYITAQDFGLEGHLRFHYPCVSGCTCMFSTLDDYAAFANMLCAGGEYKSRRILSRAAVDAMRTPHYKIGFAGMSAVFNWGYTVHVRSARAPGEQELTEGSYGWSGAYNTHFWVDPKHKLTAVFMSNMDNAGGSGAVTAREFEYNVMSALEKKAD